VVDAPHEIAFTRVVEQPAGDFTEFSGSGVQVALDAGVALSGPRFREPTWPRRSTSAPIVTSRVATHGSAGELTGPTGVEDPYEPPTEPDLLVRTARQTVEESIGDVCAFLMDRRADGGARPSMSREGGAP
jgi:hypothetical protein